MPLVETHADLGHQAGQVLVDNWRDTHTVPSDTLYPHQWSWDSAFVAFGLRHICPRRAQVELETLFDAQWADGRVPHIVFDPRVDADAYFPGPKFWQSSGAPGAPTVETSGLIQPPVHAPAAWAVHRADPEESTRRGFLERLYPRLAAWHRYLATDRDLGGRGLAAIVHPWESGMDNSPAWDLPLSRVEPLPGHSFVRRDLHHAAPADRPTDADYGRYLKLATRYRDHGYRDADTPHEFAVEDPCTNALLVAAELAMARIAEEIGADPTPHHDTAARIAGALVRLLFDPAMGAFVPRDALTGERIASVTVGGVIPLIVPGLPEEITEAVVDTLCGPWFRLTDAHMVPSYRLTAPDYSPRRYWRGPAWYNTAWLVREGLLTHGYDNLAQALRASMLETAASGGFREYVDPWNGRGRGSGRFSWTASLVLDLLRDPSGKLAGG
nr:hypothetical protein [Allostreptomyces psammosilenae]